MEQGRVGSSAARTARGLTEPRADSGEYRLGNNRQRLHGHPVRTVLERCFLRGFRRAPVFERSSADADMLGHRCPHGACGSADPCAILGDE